LKWENGTSEKYSLAEANIGLMIEFFVNIVKEISDHRIKKGKFNQIKKRQHKDTSSCLKVVLMHVAIRVKSQRFCITSC